MTRSEYLKSKGFHYYEYDETWVNGYYDIDSVVAVLDFTTKYKYGYGYYLTINNYDVFDEDDIESFKDALSDLRKIYCEAVELEDK